MDAVARKTLPVLPGDLIDYEGGDVVRFVVAALSQGESRSSEPGHEAGQWVVTLDGTQRLAQFWLDWTSYQTGWNVHRTRV